MSNQAQQIDDESYSTSLDENANVSAIRIRTIDDSPAIRSYCTRIGAEPRSLRGARILIREGRYSKNIADIDFGKDGEISIRVLPGCESEVDEADLQPTEAEKAAIREDLLAADWPTLRPTIKMLNPPPMIKNAARKDLFVFRDMNKEIIMVQVRVNHENGVDKAYYPWTYWDDNEWRCAEPEGKLPLFNEDKLKDAGVVFIHEGAKAARAMQEMIEAATFEQQKKLAAHPWGEELQHGVHVGWIGGAANPLRTNWSLINQSGIDKVYVVSDHDNLGREAAGRIAQEIKKPVKMVQVDERFPIGFDFADALPEEFFAEGSGDTIAYCGPAMRDLTHDITWGTDKVRKERKSGAPRIAVRRHFLRSVAHITSTNQYVFLDEPHRLLSAKQFDDVMASRSHTDNLSKYVARAFQGVTRNVCYRPDLPSGLVEVDGEAAVNTFKKTKVLSKAGPIEPFIEFLKYLIPNEKDRRKLLRWIATLIARPETRMAYSVLLYSEMQGVGKTTLAEEILRPLVGKHNVSIPSEQQVVDSQFTSWCARVRLIIVNEIYSGQGWKLANKLKPLLTDKTVSVNEKNQPVYSIENWAHMFACSNSSRALNIEENDRRWFIPEVTDAVWPRQKFVDLRHYLAHGGRSHIMHWAETFDAYVAPGDRAPMSRRKQKAIEESRSAAVRAAIAFAEAASDPEGPIEARPAAFLWSQVLDWIKARVEYSKITDRAEHIRKQMCDAGFRQLPDRYRFRGGEKEYILVTEQLDQVLARCGNADKRKEIDDHITNPFDVISKAM